jgi:hypothetical protein
MIQTSGDCIHRVGLKKLQYMLVCKEFIFYCKFMCKC